MTTIVLGPRPPLVEAWLEERRVKGLDGFDEVWEGEYVAAPIVHSSHGLLDQQVAVLLGPLARAAGLIGSGPLNLGKRDRSRQKLAFYAAHDVDEVLLVEPSTHTVELYGCEGHGMVRRDCSTVFDLDPEELAARLNWPVIEEGDEG